MTPARGKVRSASHPRPEHAPAGLRLHLCGDPRVVLPDGRTVGLERRAAALCALVALEPGIARERVARWLWPDAGEARRNLRQQLLRLRRMAGAPLIAGEDALALADEVRVDLEATTACSDPGVTGTLLGELDYADCDEFAAWLRGRREARLAAQLAALREALARAEGEGDLAAALAAAQGLVALDPASEAHHRELMRVHYLRADAAAGLAAYERLAKRLADELGARPGAETEQLARALRDSRAAAVPAVVPRATVAPTLSRPPRLIGREAALQALHEAWVDGPAALLLGEAGLGKSRLIAELARTRRIAVVQGRPGDAGIPYATLARLLRHAVPQAGAVLEAPHRLELARVLPELAPAVPLPADGQRLLLQEAVQQVLARSGVAAVAVDDLHFADDASVEMLLALVGAEATQELRWLFAQRPAEGGRVALALRETLEEAHALRTEVLEPLDEAALAELVDSLGLPGLRGAELAPELLRRTGGNPLFALETLKHGLAAGPGRRAALPASVGVLIERRLRQLSPPALELARLAAVAGVDFDIHLAEAVLGVSALGLADRWAELEAAQVLRGDVFAHDLVYEATLRTLPAAVARKIHADLAAQLEGRGAEPARIAAHWQGSGEGLRAVPHLVTAAERAEASFHPGVAADHYEAAADQLFAADRHDEGFDLLVRAGEAQARMSDGPRLRAVRDRLLNRARDDHQRAHALVLSCRVADFDGDHAALQVQGQRLLETAERLADRPMLGNALMFLTAAAYWSGRPADAEAPLRRARALWRELGDAQQAAECSHYLAVVLCTLSRFAEARVVYDESAAELEALQAWRELALNGRERSILLGDAGRFNDAVSLLRRSARLLESVDAGAEVWVHFTITIASSLRRLGAYAEALTTLDDHPRRFPGEQGGLGGCLALERAQLMAELGRPHLALQALEQAEQWPGLPASFQRLAAALRLRWQAAGLCPVRPLAAEATVAQDVRSGFALERARLAATPPAERARGLEATIARARALEMSAEALGARTELVLAWLELGEGARAADEALALRDGLADTVPLAYPPQAWWAVHRALRDALPAAALAALERGVDWIANASGHGLAPEFVESFLQRNPVNRELLAAAGREPRLASRLEALRRSAAPPQD